MKNNMKKVKILITGAGMLATGLLHAQDIHFSQYHAAPMLLNPALAGAEHVLQFNLNYREQWRSVSSPFKTIGASYDMRIHKSESGAFAGGLFFYNDKAGDAQMKTGLGGLSLAYHLNINEKQTIGLGIQGSFQQLSVQTSQLQWGNQYDGMEYNSAYDSGEPFSNNLTHSFGDVAAGVVWTYTEDERYITGNDKIAAVAGFSIYHPHMPQYSFYESENKRLHARYIWHGKALFGISNSRWSVVPSFMYALQGGARELVLGSWFRFRITEASHFTGFVKGAAVSIGTWYRNKDAVVSGILVEFGGNALGITYDVNVSGLKEASNGRGGFELSYKYYYPSSRGQRKMGRLL
jgi:type IX secretion system PorP/SprF family membrane protein